VDSGTLRLRLGSREVGLTAGDSVYFAADTRHGYANPGPGPCTYHVAAIIMRPRRQGEGSSTPVRIPARAAQQ
jgi:XRE family transcriptional regulator, regulator of sulfur utilization